MGCDEQIKSFETYKYCSLYQHILIDSDLKKILDKTPVYLISTESIPNFIKIIEESNIFKYKNYSNSKTLEIYENNLKKSFQDYRLERKIKIYNNYTLCKDLAGGNNENMNEFIIVDEKFLKIMRIENDLNDEVLIKWNKNRDRQIFLFKKAELNLDFESKRKGIYRFKLIDDEYKKENKKNEDISFDEDEGKNATIKKKLKDDKDKDIINNNKNNFISNFENKKDKSEHSNKNEIYNNFNQTFKANNQINNRDEKIDNQFYINKKNYNEKYIESKKNLINLDNNMINMENNMNSNNNMNNNNHFNNEKKEKNVEEANNIMNNYNMNGNINNNIIDISKLNNCQNSNNLFMNNDMMCMNKMGMIDNNMMMGPNMNNNMMNNGNMNNMNNINNINNMNNMNNFQFANVPQQPQMNINNNFANKINIFSFGEQQLINNNLMMNNFQMANNIQRNMNYIEQNNQNIPFINLNNEQIYLKEISKFKVPPLIGLANIGATCYMNATLQCLSNINLLTDFFLSNKDTFLNIPLNAEEKPISKAFSDVLYHLWNPNEPKKYYSPDYFKNIISSKNKLFQGIQANDSKDLLLFLYENIHKELNTAIAPKISNEQFSDQKNAEFELIQCRQNYFRENKSIITDLFYFDQTNITTCLNCGVKIYNFSMHNALIFPLEKTRLLKVQKNNNIQSVNLKDCFDCHINPERNQPGNQFYCNTCKQESDYLLENRISSYPEILTIVLNRGNHLEFDVNFTLSHLLDEMDDYLIQLNCNKEELGTKYRLIGIIIHTGNSGMDGHFFTYCRSPVDKKWYWFNDAIVTKINDPIEENKGIPYLLFYQKIRK